MNKRFLSAQKMRFFGVLASLVLMLSIIPNANAQFGKKLKQKMEKLKNSIEQKATDKAKKGAPNPEVSQDITAAEFETGDYEYYSSNGSTVSNYPDETNHLEFVKKDGKVLYIVLDKKVKYVPDAQGKSKFVRYFKCEKNDWSMFFSRGRIFFLEVHSDSYIDWRGLAGKRGASYAWFKEVEQFIVDTKKNQEAELAAYKSNQEAMAKASAEERRKKYSIKGKDVKSIKIINFEPSKYMSNFYAFWSYDIEATLKDGTVISTAKAEEGFIGDYKVTVENMPELPANMSNTVFTSSQLTSGFVNGDKLVLKVQSKYHPNLTDKKDMVMTYDYKEGLVQFDRSATRYGWNGEDLKLEIKQTKHAVTGEKLYQYRLTLITGNKIVAEGKLKSTQQLFIYADGQPGKPYSHHDMGGSRGGDAGDGGQILIYKDPSITGSLDTVVRARAKGGNGGKGVNYHYDGRPGVDGKITTQVKKVSF